MRAVPKFEGMAQGRNSPRKTAHSWHDSWLQPPPKPDVREGGDSAWEQWQEESRRLELAFAKTQPSNLLPLAGGEPAEAGTPRLPWSTDDAMVLARRNNRVCPQPPLWEQLYLLLEGDRYADLPPPPTQRWMWSKLSNLQRRLRFREHIEWADRHGRLEQMARFMEALAEEDWVHMGEN
jgi:hypothetical protein